MKNDRANELVLRRIFDSVPDLLLVVGPDLTVVEANDAAKARWGADIEGRSYLEFYAERFPPRRNTVKATFESGEPQSMELHSGIPSSGSAWPWIRVRYSTKKARSRPSSNRSR